MKTIDRTSYAARLATAHQDLALIKATLADAMLAADSAPGNRNLAAQIADLEAQRDRAREIIDDIEAMVAAAGRESSATAAIDNRKLIDELARAVIGASDVREALLLRIVAQIEDANPPLARYINLGAQRQQVPHGIFRAAGKTAGERLARIDGSTALIDALADAVARSGLGQVAGLASHAMVNAPTRPPTLADAERNAAGERARVIELIDEVITLNGEILA